MMGTANHDGNGLGMNGRLAAVLRRGWIRTASAVMMMVALLAAAPAKGQELFTILGDQRVGTTSMTFLKIPVGARAEALGGAYVAMANDAFAAYWNPAGVAQIGNRWHGTFVEDPRRLDGDVKGPNLGLGRLSRGDRTVGFVRINWIADITYDVLSWTQPLPLGVLGVSAASLGMADMEVTTEYRPDGTGEYFTYSDQMLALTYAMPMTDNFSWGVNLKYVRETLADTHMDNVLLDLGTYYWTGYRDLRLGVALMHLGPNARPEGTYVGQDADGNPVQRQFNLYAPPTEFRLGAAMTAVAVGAHRVLTTVQLNHPVDNAENLKAGVEYELAGMIFLRGGYKFNTDEDRFSFGAGVRVPLGPVAFSADYSYTDFGILDQVQRLSLGINF